MSVDMPKNETKNKPVLQRKWVQGLLQGLGLGLGLVLTQGLLQGLGLAHEVLQGVGLALGMGVGLGLRLALIEGLLQGVGLLLILLLMVNRLSSKQSSSTSQLNRLYTLFPEEQRNDVTTKLRRFKKKKKPQWFIWLKASQYWLELLIAAIQIGWDNLWLPRNRNIDK